MLNYEVKIKRNALKICISKYSCLGIIRIVFHSMISCLNILKMFEVFFMLGLRGIRSVQYGRTRVYFHIDNRFLLKTID